MATNKTLVVGAAGTGVALAGLLLWQHHAGTSFADAAAAGDEVEAERAARVLAMNDGALVHFLFFAALATLLVGAMMFQSQP